MKKYLTLENLSVLLLLTINVAFAALYVLQNTITFHTDIARDFLLLEDMFYNKNISLIGPRSGGIPGVFHGPLWIYLNLPAYIIGKGDPVIVGWFWVLLFVASIILVYWVGKKLWNKEVGIMSALLVSVTTLSDIHNLFNPYGAVITFPLFLYFIGKYLETKKILQLVLALFTLGIIIQFQMAFGGPILILMIGYLIYDSIIKKNIKPLLALAVLIIPLSSFIVFELRNNFLQTHSVYNYITGVETALI
ncbi:MAG: glycosyltransferase family 39 protein [Weeksellaceae bacterium]